MNSGSNESLILSDEPVAEEERVEQNSGDGETNSGDDVETMTETVEQNAGVEEGETMTETVEQDTGENEGETMTETVEQNTVEEEGETNSGDSGKTVAETVEQNMGEEEGEKNSGEGGETVTETVEEKVGDEQNKINSPLIKDVLKKISIEDSRFKELEDAEAIVKGLGELLKFLRKNPCLHDVANVLESTKFPKHIFIPSECVGFNPFGEGPSGLTSSSIGDEWYNNDLYKFHLIVEEDKDYGLNLTDYVFLLPLQPGLKTSMRMRGRSKILEFRRIMMARLKKIHLGMKISSLAIQVLNEMRVKKIPLGILIWDLTMELGKVIMNGVDESMKKSNECSMTVGRMMKDLVTKGGRIRKVSKASMKCDVCKRLLMKTIMLREQPRMKCDVCKRVLL